MATQMSSEFVQIPIEQVHPSKTNPRTHFDPAALVELAASVRQHGVLEPILVRPTNGDGTYEIIAGHRRYLAAQQAQLARVPAIVRKMDDLSVLEIQVVENLQRADLHPLEEAAGYNRLLTYPGYDVEKIAQRIDRSTKYIYDRIKLLQLIEPIRKVFLSGEITAGHAILLARLSPADQQRATAVDRSGYADYQGGLWRRDATLFADDKQEHRKPCSVRELEAWIQQHVRYNDKQIDAFDHPETAEALKTATEAEEKVIHITHNYHVRPEAKTAQRVWGPLSWRPVKGKPCAHAITGVIVIGEGRSQALKVCIEKEKCATHWKDWQKERAARAKQSAKGGGTAQERYQKEREREKAEQARAEALRARWKKAAPAILEALAAAVKKAPARANGFLAKQILERCQPDYGGPSYKALSGYVPLGTTAEDLVRHAAFCLLAPEAGNAWRGPEEFPKIARVLGLDVKKILDQAAPVQTSAKKAAGKPAAGAEDSDPDGIDTD